MSLGGRALRNWGLLALQVGFLLVAVGSLQLVAQRTNVRLDLTATRSLSLSPITENIVAEVDGPLAITVFYRRGERGRHVGLLRRLQAELPALQWEALDLDRHPERARSLGVGQYGRAVVEYAGRNRVVDALPEESLAGGILAVVRGRRRRVGLVTGHGERGHADEQDGLGRLLAALEVENYAPEAMSLLDGPVPPDTDLVVIAGPRSDFLPRELAELDAYLAGGGGVLMLLDPGTMPRLAAFLAERGVQLRDDFVVDRTRRVLATDGLAAIVEHFLPGNPVSHPPANPLATGVVLPSARSVDLTAERRPGVDAADIARTGPTAWAMTDPARARRGAEPDPAARDLPGPVPMAAMAEIGPPAVDGRRGRLVVIGDSDFATDAYVDLLSNRDLVLNAVAWTAGEEDVLAGVRAKNASPVTRPLSPLMLTDAQARGVLVTVALVEPGLVLLVGVVVVLARRRRG